MIQVTNDRCNGQGYEVVGGRDMNKVKGDLRRQRFMQITGTRVCGSKGAGGARQLLDRWSAICDGGGNVMLGIVTRVC